MPRRLFSVVSVSLWLILCFAQFGCIPDLAEVTVKAPNLQQSRWRSHTLYPDVLELMDDAKQLDIFVGPPDAKLHAWVSEPLPGGLVDYKVEIFGLNQRAKIKRLPAPQPATQPFKPRGTIVLLHGISDRQELDPYVLYKEFLRTGGYRIVQVDLRGHGRSTGPWISYGVFESKDMVQVLDELDRQGLLTGPVGVLGISYGAAVAIQWAAIDPRVKAVVAVEPYSTFEQVARDAAWIMLGPLRPMLGEDWFKKNIARAGAMAGFDPAQASPLAAIQRVKTPVLLLHSRADELTPYQHSQELYNAAPDHSKMIVLNGHSHFTIWATALHPILSASADWFRTYLKE